MKITSPSMALRADEVSQLDGQVISDNLPRALLQLEQAKGGFRTGLDPPPQRPGDVDLTTTERLALTPDRARQDESRVFALLTERMVVEAELASLLAGWGKPVATPLPSKIDPKAIGIDGTYGERMCSNHLAHGRREAARPGHGDLCDWCASVKATYSERDPAGAIIRVVLPNKSLIEARHTQVKKRLQAADYERHLGIKRKTKT